MIKLFPKRDEYKDKGRFLGLGGSPDIEWKIMFSIFLFLFAVMLAYSATTFINVMSGSFGSELADTSESPIDKNLLRRSASFYKEKRVNFESLKTTKEVIPDPSI